MLSILVNRKVIAISQSVKNSLIKYEFIPERKIYVLPNCIDYQDFREIAGPRKNSEEKQIIIGTVGRLERQKGTKYLLMAMKIILSKYPYTRLEIVGDGSLLEELKNFSCKLAISNSVIFFGKFVNVKPFYSRMDVFVLPSIYEGFGIVLLEAMASGVPVVATNVDGIKEVILDSECGILVPPKNPEAIAEAVIKIIENPQLSKSLIDEGFKRAKLFDIQEHVMKLDNLYTNLLGIESYR
jgi:glycosyltransferase involved in cell wall biosynthesis